LPSPKSNTKGEIKAERPKAPTIHYGRGKWLLHAQASLAFHCYPLRANYNIALVLSFGESSFDDRSKRA
jgi:hypothetical protein